MTENNINVNNKTPHTVIYRRQNNIQPEKQALGQQQDDMTGQINRLGKLAEYLERMNIVDYIEMNRKPGRVIKFNILYGLSRGFGFAIGFTLLGALVFYILNQLNILNLPVIGNFLADLLEYVEKVRGTRI